VFWTGEGGGVGWPGAVLMLVPLAAVFLLAGILLARTARRTFERTPA